MLSDPGRCWGGLRGWGVFSCVFVGVCVCVCVCVCSCIGVVGFILWPPRGQLDRQKIGSHIGSLSDSTR